MCDLKGFKQLSGMIYRKFEQVALHDNYEGNSLFCSSQTHMHIHTHTQTYTHKFHNLILHAGTGSLTCEGYCQISIKVLKNLAAVS